jgi:chromodomain-helicase-DNA-binding protein 1
VDRILDIEDDTVNVQTMDWAKARLPSFGGDSTPAPVEEEIEVEESVQLATEEDLADTPVKASEEANDEDQDDEPKRSKRKMATDKAETKKKSRKPKVVVDLHGANCWVVVKWEGLSYSEFTLESAYDLSKAGVDYEFALREFFRREQQVPRVGVRGKCVRSLFNMASVLESPVPPTFPVGQLRDYQWEGVRWLLFNWSQKRNSILADEMVRFFVVLFV